MPALKVHSRPLALAKFDLRTPEGRLLWRVRKDLTEHVGGAPSKAQRVLIDRAAWLTLHLDQLDAKALRPDGLTDFDRRTYSAWCTQVTRILKTLGMKGAAAKPRSLAEHLADASRPAA